MNDRNLQSINPNKLPIVTELEIGELEPKISFEEVLTEEDIELLYNWLQQEDIMRRYDSGKVSYGEYRKKIEEKIQSDHEYAYFIVVNGKRVGYIQCYNCLKEGYPLFASKDMRGVDLFIGDNSDYQKGLGAMALKRFTEEVVIAMHMAKKVIIDPNKDNERAIKAFERAGFMKTGRMIDDQILMEYKDVYVKKINE